MIKTILLSFGLLLSGCSNISVGFEEDSIFYTSPKEAVSEKVKSKQVKVQKKVELQKNMQATAKTQETLKVKDAIAPIISIKADELEKEKENETTFYYDPYAGE